MQTIERPVAPVERLARNNRFLIVGLVVAILLAAGLGAWLIVDNAQTAVEREITALVEDYYRAWQAGDGQAVIDLMTEDATMLPVQGGTYTGSEISRLVESPESRSFPVELAEGPLIVNRSHAILPAGRIFGWHAASSTIVPDYDSQGDWRQMELFHIVEQDGRYLIELHETWKG